MLDASARAAQLERLAEDEVDVLVVGLGVTGAGVALDAASRGLRVAAVDAHDLAFGTSRWSSKLVHGGLRYLAKGQLGVAHESAVERGILMTRTAPHLTRALPMVMPLGAAIGRPQATLAMQGIRAGDVLRRTTRTPGDLLPRPRRLSAAQTLHRAPAVTTHQLRGGLLSYDGQLEDDARLVTALARTAASYGARVLTHLRASDLRADGATLRDEQTGSTLTVRARVVVNATGVWAADLVPGLRLTPSRGTHLVLRSTSLVDTPVSLSAPVPGSVNRFVFTLPQPDGLTYLGLTDEPTEGVPDVPDARGARGRLPARHHQRGARAPPDPRRRGRALRRAAAAAHRRGPHRRPLPQARRAGLRDRCRDRGRRQAHDLPPDGAGRGRRGGPGSRGSTRGRAAPPTCPWSAPRLAPTSPRSTRSRRRRDWSAATAPRPRA